MMKGPVFINGRFVSQPVTGVQRFSSEMVSAIECLMQRGEWPDTALLTPQRNGNQGSYPVTPDGRLRSHVVGRRSGHLWEQIDLPRAARGGILVNLGNTAPVLAGRGQVVVIHDAGVFDTPYSYSRRFRLWYKTLQHTLTKVGAEIATVSEFSRQRIAACLKIEPARITVLYEGADHILRVPADPNTLKRHDLRPRQFALVVGSLVAHKNLAALTEVGAMLRRRGMVIAVAGGSNQEVFQTTSDGGVERRLGRTTDGELRALYENAACLLFPSRYEGFGLPPVEAMTCGCPVVTSYGGAVEEICGDSALYFNSRDLSSLSTKVERLLSEDGLAADLRSRGVQRAASLSWIASARILGDVVRRACGQ